MYVLNAVHVLKNCVLRNAISPSTGQMAGLGIGMLVLAFALVFVSLTVYFKKFRATGSMQSSVENPTYSKEQEHHFVTHNKDYATHFGSVKVLCISKLYTTFWTKLNEYNHCFYMETRGYMYTRHYLILLFQHTFTSVSVYICMYLCIVFWFCTYL